MVLHSDDIQEKYCLVDIIRLIVDNQDALTWLVTTNNTYLLEERDGYTYRLWYHGIVEDDKVVYKYYCRTPTNTGFVGGL